MDRGGAMKEGGGSWRKEAWRMDNRFNGVKKRGADKSQLYLQFS